MRDAISIPASTWDVIDSQARSFLETKSAPAIAYAVVQDGRIIHTGGVGEASLSAAAPREHSVFRIASMTKSFTAAAILILRDEGKLRLDDAIHHHLPQLSALVMPTADSRMPTIRDLLTMSAGWPTDDPWADREESMSPDEYDALLKNGFTFNFAPGTGFEYSNLGYTMLGRIITNVSGLQYQDYIATRILAPLGMTSSGFQLTDIEAKNLADGHFFRDGHWHVEPTSETGEFAPLGGLFSTCADLARWVGVMTSAFPARDDVDAAIPLSRASLREMQQGQRVIAPSVAVATAGQPLWLSSPAYGFGLLIGEDPVRGTVVGHSGGYPGYGTHMCWHPETGLGVIALSNGRYGGAFRVANSMLRTVVDAALAPARIIAITPATQAARRVVDSILDEWDDDALDSLTSANFDADIPRQVRREEIQAALTLIGSLRPPLVNDQVSSTSQSHLVWWREGECGRLRIEIRLTPQNPQRVQTLNIRAIPQPSGALEVAVKAVVDACEIISEASHLGQWPTDLPTAESVDTHSVLAMAFVARTLEPAGVFGIARNPVSAVSHDSATFEVRRGELVWELALAVDAELGVVTSCSLTQRPLTSDARASVQIMTAENA